MSTEQIRLLLLGALLVVTFSLWSAWEKDYSQKPSTISAVSEKENSISTQNANETPLIGQNFTIPQTTTSDNRFVEVKTDVLDVLIDKVGGNVVKTSLLTYPKELDASKGPFVLLNDDPSSVYVVQSGLITKGGLNPKQQPLYSSSKDYYALASDQNEITIDLKWRNSQGLLVTKSFDFKRGSYLTDITFEINNGMQKPWQGNLYAELDRKNVTPANKGFFQINPYIGAAVSSPEKRYEKISFKSMSEQEFNREIQNGWVAFQQHYFLSALIPEKNQLFHYTTKVLTDNVYALGLTGSTLILQPGQQQTTSIKLYTGPAIADVLKKIAPGLDLTVDYGMLWFLGVAIFWVMKHIYNIVGNWGWSIVLVTVLIKLLFYKLSAASYKSMAAMRRLQPKLTALKERYGDDRQKLSQATMDLYKKEKINPLGGCLPIIVQIPVFIALYWVLLESVQLRQAPFILWIKDLSVQDPYYVLPILMGITIFIQQKLNPPPPDPVQAKVMMILPVIFTALFVSFPAGLVLYWAVNNVLSIIQQWYITRKFA